MYSFTSIKIATNCFLMDFDEQKGTPKSDHVKGHLRGEKTIIVFK